MSKEHKEWQKLAAKIGRAMGLFEPTPKEASDAMRTAGAVPMFEGEIDEIARGVCKQPEHNSDGLPCSLTIKDDGVGDHQRAVHTTSWLAALARDNTQPDPTRDAAHRAYDAVVALSKLL